MFEAKQFNIPDLRGISKTNIEEHLKLYAGYVKHSNLILEKIAELSKNSEANAFILGELQRRFSFEFNGMRNHEHYFGSLEEGPKSLSPNSRLGEMIGRDWGSFDNWLARFKQIAATRGIGWAVLYYDEKSDKLLNAWIDEQHLGQLNGLRWIVGIDMWEHSFVADYQPSGKKKYIDDYFANLNWTKAEENFK